MRHDFRMDFSITPPKLTKSKSSNILANASPLLFSKKIKGDGSFMLAHALLNGPSGMTESQWQLAENLGWTEDLGFSPFRELIQYLDSAFSRFGSKEVASVQIPEPPVRSETGSPFYAMNNHRTLAVSREFVRGKAVYRSNFNLLQASEEYEESLSTMMQYLTRGRESAVFCKVTKLPEDFELSRKSVMTCCSAECDVFLPTGLCKGLSRRNSAHITDAEVFSSIVMDYVKVMQRIQKRGYSLRTHFYLTRGCDIRQILASPEFAKVIWAEGGYRDYQCVTINADGEVSLELRQEASA